MTNRADIRPGLKGSDVMGTERVVVDGVAVSPGQTEGALMRREESGVMALALMPDEDFENRLATLKRGQERIRRIQRELMEEDEDYGTIPGTKKPTLLKPGAEKLCNIYGLVPTYDVQWLEGDGESTPDLRCRMTCYMHRGDENGPVAGVGVGAANSWERKHRYRSAERSCPACGCVGTIRRSKFPDKQTGDKGWYCHDKAGGCGTNFHSEDPLIADQERGMVENKDPYDVENTLFKMAKKRAKIDATLDATATSGLFTQDLEENLDPGPAPVSEPQERPAPAPAKQAAAPAKAPTRQAAPPAPKATEQATVNGNGRWHGPCPRCGKTGTVIKNKYQGGWVCWKNGNPPGCDYKFTQEDVEVHDGAAQVRQAQGNVFEGREPGSDD